MKTIDEHLSDISFADTESQCGYPCRSPDLVKERDREVAAAARREGWEAGVFAAANAMLDVTKRMLADGTGVPK